MMLSVISRIFSVDQLSLSVYQLKDDDAIFAVDEMCSAKKGGKRVTRHEPSATKSAVAGAAFSRLLDFIVDLFTISPHYPKTHRVISSLLVESLRSSIFSSRRKNVCDRRPHGIEESCDVNCVQAKEGLESRHGIQNRALRQEGTQIQ